jgi:hypothetical protein
VIPSTLFHRCAELALPFESQHGERFCNHVLEALSTAGMHSKGWTSRRQLREISGIRPQALHMMGKTTGDGSPAALGDGAQSAGLALSGLCWTTVAKADT